jgi:hypothetical protein
MSSFLGWIETASATTKKENTNSANESSPLLDIAVEAGGLDASGPDEPDHSPIATSLSPVPGQNDDDHMVDVDGDSNESDYVLDSDHSESPRSPCSDQPESDMIAEPDSTTDVTTSKSFILRKRTDKSITKVSSTGNLRVYHKTDLKNKISAVEHRLLFLEKRLQQLEKKSPIANQDSSIPTCIKLVAGCLLLLHIGRCL